MKERASSAKAKPAPRQQRDGGDYSGVERDPAVKKLRGYARPRGVGFQLRKIGHVVLNCRDLERSIRFYTEVLGFQVSDVYPQDMVPGGMAFLRCNTDHHGIGLVGGLDQTIRIRNLARRGGVADFSARPALAAGDLAGDA